MSVFEIRLKSILMLLIDSSIQASVVLHFSDLGHSLHSSGADKFLVLQIPYPHDQELKIANVRKNLFLTDTTVKTSDRLLSCKRS